MDYIDWNTQETCTVVISISVKIYYLDIAQASDFFVTGSDVRIMVVAPAYLKKNA